MSGVRRARRPGRPGLRELRRELRELRVVAGVGEIAASAADEAGLLAGATAVVRDAIAPEGCGLLLLDEAEGVLRHAPSYHSRRSSGPFAPVRLGEGLAGACAETGLVRRLAADGSGTRAQVQDPRAAVCVPLRIGPRVIGVLQVESTRKAGFTAQDERLLGLVAAQLASALDRLRSSHALRESEERFRSLSQASLDAIVIHDGVRIIDVNQALCELGDYSAEDLVGRGAFEIIVPEYREMVYRNLLVEYGAPYEIEVVKSDGTHLPVEIQGRSFAYRGRVLRVVSVRDLSARREAAAVRDSLLRELDARKVEMERFGDAVAHDLKAPLLTIRGFAEHLERDVVQGRTDRLAADARRVADGAERLQRMLDELVDFSRAGRPVGPPMAVPAEYLVREALRLVGARVAESRARVEVGRALPIVYGDRARLVRVFRNLLDNAAKFAAGAECPVVEVAAREPRDGKAVLVVRDNGIGIDAVNRDRVFDPFEKHSGSEGVGIGLAVVKRIVEAHGGRVWLESEGSGSGTSVCFTLPQPPSTALDPASRSCAADPRKEAFSGLECFVSRPEH